MEFNTEFLQFSSLGTSIYRLWASGLKYLGAVRTVDKRRLDGQLWDRLSKFCRKSFLNCRVRTVLPYHPNSCTLAALNFHIKTWHVRTMKTIIRTGNLMHVISISKACASEQWRLSSGRLNFECATCLMDERVWMGIHIVQAVANVFPYLCFGKKSHSRSNTKWSPDVLLKRPDGCKLEQFELLDTEDGPNEKFLSSKRMMLWTVGCPDCISRRPGGFKGSDFSDL
jgi:hypothetical protein